MTAPWFSPIIVEMKPLCVVFAGCIACIAQGSYVALVASAQSAQLSPTSTQPISEQRSLVRYGWQIALADTAVVLMLLAKTNDTVPQLLYALGGPTTHVVHGQFGSAALSLGLRFALPAIGLLGGVVADDSEIRAGSVTFGALAGIAAAITIDWIILGKKTVYQPAVAPMFVVAETATATVFGVAGRW